MKLFERIYDKMLYGYCYLQVLTWGELDKMETLLKEIRGEDHAKTGIERHNKH